MIIRCTDEASAAEAQLCTRANSYACLDSSSLGYQQLETLSYSFELPDKYVNLVDNGGTGKVCSQSMKLIETNGHHLLFPPLCPSGLHNFYEITFLRTGDYDFVP